MARNFVSEDHAAVAMNLAIEVERGNMSRSTATHSLIGDYGFKPHTANAYIDCYSHLRAGTAWKATISDAAVQMMLDVIAPKGGNALFLALQSIQGHINYFAGRGSRRPSLAAVLDEYKRELAASAALMPANVSLENQVRLSAEDAAETRLARLAAASPKPKVTIRLVYEFLRNPDVVVEVLARANGVCEACGMKAPFNRRSNGSAYLEVHHRIRLADGGNDTIENALALCPNCHRYEHFG